MSNEYDSSSRVILQTQADGSTYHFSYTTDANNRIIATDVTDQLGHVRRVSFNSCGYIISDIASYGSAEQQTVLYDREPDTNLVTAMTDQLGRLTRYAYNELGRVTSVILLANTPKALTYTYTYESSFGLLESVTDTPCRFLTTLLAMRPS